MVSYTTFSPLPHLNASTLRWVLKDNEAVIFFCISYCHQQLLFSEVERLMLPGLSSRLKTGQRQAETLFRGQRYKKSSGGQNKFIYFSSRDAVPSAKPKVQSEATVSFGEAKGTDKRAKSQKNIPKAEGLIRLQAGGGAQRNPCYDGCNNQNPERVTDFCRAFSTN